MSIVDRVRKVKLARVMYKYNYIPRSGGWHLRLDTSNASSWVYVYYSFEGNYIARYVHDSHNHCDVGKPSIQLTRSLGECEDLDVFISELEEYFIEIKDDKRKN